MSRNGRSWNDWTAPRLFSPAYNKLTRERFAAVAEELLVRPFEEVKTISEYADEPSIVSIVASAIVIARTQGNYNPLDKMLDRVIGKVKQEVVLTEGTPEAYRADLSFSEFCVNAGYPPPFDRQIEMMEFGIRQQGVKMILGSRGYGKTDYVVILGSAYQIYLDRQMTFLLVTKSADRNKAILAEISKALRANGVDIEVDNATCVRVTGLKGKDHSVEAVPMGSSFRGRHPRKAIMDDPVTEEDVSEATRKKVQSKYNELSKLTSDILIIGQPVHKFDLYETLRPFLNKMEVPHGSIPELDHDLEAQRLAGVSEESIQASYFLKVVSDVGYPLERVSFIDEFPKGDSVAFIDPSYEGGDYTALSIIKAYGEGVAVKGGVWKRAWYDCLDAMCDEMEACGVQRVCFETNSLGEQPVVLLRSLIDIGVVGMRTIGNKHSRILAAGAFAKSIFLAKTSHRTYIDQVTKYEYGTKYDDAPDSLASGLQWIGLIRGRD